MFGLITLGGLLTHSNNSIRVLLWMLDIVYLAWSLIFSKRWIEVLLWSVTEFFFLKIMIAYLKKFTREVES